MSNSIFEPIFGAKLKDRALSLSQPVLNTPPSPTRPQPPVVFQVPALKVEKGNFGDWTPSRYLIIAVVVILVLAVWLYFEKKRKDSLLKKIAKEVRLLRKYRG